MRRAVLVWLAVSTTAGAVQAPTTLRFLPATTDSAGVWFDHPDSLDWERMARRALPKLNFARPDTLTLIAGWHEPAGASAVPFRAPLTPSVPSVHYVGLAPDGTVPISPQQLGGQVFFKTRPPRWRVTRHSVYGRILGRQAAANRGRSLSVVFVAWAATPFNLQHSPATASVSDTIQVVGTGGERWTFPVKETFLDLRGLRNLSAAVFREPGTGRVFVMVGGDSDLCEGSFLLYEAAAAPRLLAQRGGVCDP